MTRSKRKTPVRGITTAPSEKSDKVVSHRKVRRTVRQNVADSDKLLPTEKELTGSHSMAKDGKARFDSKSNPKLMRK